LSDDTTAPVNADTPDTPENEGTTTDTPQFDESRYVPIDRYAEAQSWGTRASQEAAQLREQIEEKEQQNLALQVWHNPDADPDQKRIAAEILGLEYEEPKLEDGTDPQVAELLKFKQQFETWQSSQQEQAAQEQLAQQESEFIDEALVKFEQANGLEFSWEQTQLIASHAFMNRDQQGRPNVEAGIELVTGLSPKRKPKPPPAPGSGQPAGELPDKSTHDKRVERMAAKLQAMES
jgi:hypothetical protein